MRVLGRLITGLLAVLIVLIAGAYFFRAPLAGEVLRRALVSAGVDNPALTVEEISLSALRVSGVSAGGGALSVERASATYSWRTLIRDRRIETIAVGPGRVRMDIAADGGLSIAGARLPAGEGTGPLPFDALAIDDVAFAVAAPEGEGRGRISGAFTPEEGGALALTAATPLLATDVFTIRDGALDASVDLAADGAFEMKGALKGAFRTEAAAVESAAALFDLSGASWRDALAGALGALSVAGSVEIQSADILTAESAPLAFLAAEDLLGDGPVRRLSLSGAARIAAEAGRLSIEPANAAPIAVAADRGDRLTITGIEGAPFYEQSPDGRRAGFSAALAGAAEGSLVLAAESAPDGPWRIDASMAADAGEGSAALEELEGGAWRFEVAATLRERSVGDVSLGATQFTAAGTASPEDAAGDVRFSTVVRAATVGPLAVSDAALSGVLAVDADIAGRTMRVSTPGADCVALARARLAVEGQDSTARLDDARLCNAAEPLAVVNWGEAARVDVAGRLTARRAVYRLGETRLEGAPPRIDFTSTHNPAAQHTDVEGVFAGGRVVLNEIIVATDAQGRFSAGLDPAGLTGAATLARATLSHNAEPVQVAPVVARATIRLADDVFTFDYSGATIAGASLGTGSGRHDIRSGLGETTVDTGRLSFAPGGLQPAAILPALTGIVGRATGAANAEARFAWGPAETDPASTAAFRFDGLTFMGPGRAVSETSGLSGSLALSSLAPLKSEGPQALTVRGVNLDALLLENGRIEFDLPGDETLRVIRASFPWFGGTLGAEDGVASFATGEAEIRLRADRLDLAQILDYFDVNGLSGEGIISGVLPIEVRDGRTFIVEGELRSDGPGAVRYQGEATDTAATAAGGEADIAFSILRDLRFSQLRVVINGPLDGRLDFQMDFEGTGEVPVNRQRVRVPVRYRISLDAALLELLSQASLSQSFQLQIQRGLEDIR